MNNELNTKSYQKIYIICLNPHCLKDRERCLTINTMHSHPKQCASYFYPAEQIQKVHWSKLQKYPVDSLGISAKKKLSEAGQQTYLIKSMNILKDKILTLMKQVQNKLLQLYPNSQFRYSYQNVYNLQKIAESLKYNCSPSYITNQINSNFSAQNYHILLRINQSYDDLSNTIKHLSNKLLQQFDVILKKHTSTQVINHGRKGVYKKINYGVKRSKFIASSKIQCENQVVVFPIIPHIASFLPWIYTDKFFNDGIHQFKISSIKYPMVQNTGFTVLDEHDIDTYPYTHFKSLFNRQGKGFKLVSGEEIDQFIAQTTIITLKIELGPCPKAYIYDSQMKCSYECALDERKNYRMGVYGCGWAMEIIELN